MKAKAGLLAKSFSRVEGVDNLETFAPTPSVPSIRLMATIACENDLEIYHLNAKQAFVQSKLDEEIYMRLPRGHGNQSGSTVLLNKSLSA